MLMRDVHLRIASEVRPVCPRCGNDEISLSSVSSMDPETDAVGMQYQVMHCGRCNFTPRAGAVESWYCIETSGLGAEQDWVPDLHGRELAWLEARRAELLALMSRVGDFRPGAVYAVWRKCSDPLCECAQQGHKGHGPDYKLALGGFGRPAWTVDVKRGPELDAALMEVAEHRRFAAVVDELTAVSAAICAHRPACGTTPAPGEESG